MNRNDNGKRLTLEQADCLQGLLRKELTAQQKEMVRLITN